MTENESNLHLVIEERDREIETLRAESSVLRKVVEAQRQALSQYAETVEGLHAENLRVVTNHGHTIERAQRLRDERDGARATLARVEAVSDALDRAIAETNFRVDRRIHVAAADLRSTLATPTEARP